VSDLGGRLSHIRAQREDDEQAELDAEMRGRGMAYGMRMAAELVAAVIVGGLIGYGLDAWLGTKPWLFLLFFLLGFAAGVLNVVRAYEGMRTDIAARTGGRIGQRIDDDDD
jgi:ATP synthase protein I